MSIATSSAQGSSVSKRGEGRAALQEHSVQSQYLTFTLGSEVFAMPIECIREIIEFGGLTTVPLMPSFLRGVINLRGAVVPVIDLSVRFSREATGIGRRTCIVILEIEQDGVAQAIGVIVDAVNEVLSINAADIEPRPSFGARIRSDFITGIIRHQERFIISLDVQRVLSVDEMAGLAELTLDDGAGSEPL
jgi:purine-binding chemotaxis protein CheW